MEVLIPYFSPCAEIEDAEPMEIGEEPTLSSNTCSSDTIAVAPKNSG